MHVLPVFMWMHVNQCIPLFLYAYARTTLRENWKKQQSIGGRKKLGPALPHHYSTSIRVLLASLRTRYTLFTPGWPTMEGSMNEEWKRRGGKETGTAAWASRWRNKFAVGAELSGEWDFSLGLICVNKWKRGNEEIKDAAIAKLCAYVRSALTPFSISGEEFFIKF